MEDEQRRPERFLAFAQEAEKQALKCKDPQIRDKWLKIALTYRELAQRRPGSQPAETSPEQVLPSSNSQVPTRN